MRGASAPVYRTKHCIFARWDSAMATGKAIFPSPKESPVNIRADLQRRITDTLEIAQKMGGSVIVLKNEDVADALISFAREYGITHIVLGRPSTKKIQNPFKRSVHEKLIRDLPDVQIVMA